MAISRREIMRLGVSYGTGTINFGNDSVAYDRELRKLSSCTQLKEFVEALEHVQKDLAAQAEGESAQEQSQEPEANPAESAAFPNPEPPTQSELDPSARSEPEPEVDASEGTAASNETEESEEEQPANPLAPAIDAACNFRELCSRLALSELYLKTQAIINALNQEVLPSVEEVNELESKFNKIIDYLQHC